ncbi:MAG TPA: cyclomaltodextrinase C-terminal domain-containing protein, partial [Pyrinomonadaceae bacterium]|nr:cyclomaltodextrinase C-terminal domain-containing protein [Pyrinomonadaceae bacterium]
KGALFNLHVSEQQYAFARLTVNSGVIVVINNANEPAELEFDATTANLADGTTLRDRLDASKDVVVRNGKLRVSLPKRSAAIFIRG